MARLSLNELSTVGSALAVAFVASRVGPQTSLPFSISGSPIAVFLALMSWEKRSPEGVGGVVTTAGGVTAGGVGVAASTVTFRAHTQPS
jgi:hypothetical protein